MNEIINATGTIVTADNISLFYSIDGPNDAPWLILSNSLATDMRIWNFQVAAFSETHRVVRYDTRGHGQSSVPTEVYGFKQLADDVAALMDALNIDVADFVGISMGGMTGMAVAVYHPKRLRKLVCCDARADSPAPYKAIWDGNIKKVHESSISAVSDTTIERWFTEAFRTAPENEQTLSLVRDMIGKTPDEGYMLAAKCLRSLDLLRHLSTIKCPTLFVVGEHDPAASVAVMQDMTDKTPDASLVVIDAAAHLSNMEQPAAFTDVVAPFISAT